MSDHTVTSLIRKISRAEMKLEEAKVSHADRCVVENDPEGYAPCSCGASATNAAINAALQELKL